MVNVLNELIASEPSAEDQLIHWKHNSRGIFSLKYFKGFVYLLTKLIACDHE